MCIILMHAIYRYMHRRCNFLEECPHLKYDAPSGPVKRKRTKKMVTEKERCTKLLSVLFRTMRREVAYFCEQCVGCTHDGEMHYHQV